MKTILIVISGMGDLPDPVTLRETPLSVAEIPSLDLLARRGELTAIPSVPISGQVSHKNALLSILGYDLQRGEPTTEELMEFGLNNSSLLTDYPSLCPFIIPGFSGHGVCITTSAWVRGVAKSAFLRPLDIYSPGSSDGEILQTVSRLTTQAVPSHEFVFIYVDTPLRATLRGDYDAKVKALETIDRYLITPIADYVWKSDLFINLAITTDLITPWHTRIPSLVSVPAVVYFNNHDWEGNPDQSFTEVEAMLMDRSMLAPSDLIRFLSNFSVSEEESTPPPSPPF